MADDQRQIEATPQAPVTVHPGKLAETKWSQHALRFAFGGAITAAAGWVSHEFGPVVGGLFLAFPAILPASLSIVKQREGRAAAGLDAAGAVTGSIGLMAFALVIWRADARITPAYALVLAAIAWLLVSVEALVVLLRFHHPGDDER